MEEKLSNPTDIKEQIHTASVPKRPLPKMVILLGISFLIIVMLFIAFTILRNQRVQELRDTTATEITRPAGEILFETPEVKASNNQTVSVDIEISTGGNPVGGVVLGVKYNPLLIKNVKLEAIKDNESPLSQILAPLGDTTYDTANGAALLSLKSLAKDPVTGRGKVARLTFVKASLNVAVDSTEITFLPTTNFITVQEGIIPLTKNLITVSF